MLDLLSQAPETSILIALLLGLLQGLTEFLPISSSGHLVLAQELLRAPAPGIAVEVILHAGTLLAVLVTYRRDLWGMVRGLPEVLRPRFAPACRLSVGTREAGLLILATLPVVLAGLLWRGSIEDAFDSPSVASSMLVVTGILLLSTKFAKPQAMGPNAMIALIMGAMQVLSLLPGISRSGATISGGLFAGGDPKQMARFSFLMSVPAILGSLVLQLPELAASWRGGLMLPYAAGFFMAFLSGLVAIRILLRLVARGRFFVFGIYCILAGLLAWILVARPS
ncbi:MAG: undecaprenyl-diphosphate phosphatase [Candidatus Eisenbacteria sp.]|nr:undecaprenyl-diphosphate phosphatase [Candidatus Eisenbacteria bacterium]